MIKVGIIGCDNLAAGELLRVLINHPDVEVKWVQDVACTGERVDHVVPGIVGECDLTISGTAALVDVDLVFLTGSRDQVEASLSTLDWPDDLKVIDLSGCHNLDHGEGKPWTYGLSEMQRRILVHGSRLVTMPGIAAEAVLLALLPLARNLLLNSPLTLHLAIGTAAFSESDSTVAGLSMDDWIRDQRQELTMALGQCQSSFNQPVELTVAPLAERRTLTAAARLKCGLDGETIRQLYEQYYDDHNFVFMVDRPVVTADIENTNKCLIYLEKDDHSGLLTIHAVMDVLLKGCAGNAVHAMNLLFGLHERVGLALKGTGC
ncbi:MAG: hypothetical protein IJV05_04760 [Muribaculaceae bacterium]|nr:hypothetical protein [Muribaculaceae bacterium]